MATSRTYRVTGNVVGIDRTTRRGPRLLTGDRVVAQAGRFVLSGGTANVAYVLVFLALAGSGQQLANAVGALVSAALASELHRRFTFRAGARVHWRTAQWQGGATAALATAASSLALAWLAATTDAGTLPALLLAAAVNGAVGLLRFLTLRWLFVRPALTSPGVLTALPAPVPVASAA